MSSNAEDNLHRRKFKGLCDSIPVHPASVPRKLRSAISKRSPRSASLPTMDSKRLKHSINGGVASLRTDYLKKMKANMYASEPLSKEEEEVAETLFALAGMISSDGESSKAKTPECNDHDDPMSSSKDVVIRKEEPGTACNQSTGNADEVSVGDGPERHSIPGKPTTETPINWPNLSEKRQLNEALNVSVHPQRMPLLRACDEKVVLNSCTSSQLPNDAIWHTSVSDAKTEKASFPSVQSQHFVDSQVVDKVSNHERSSASVFPSWANAPASSSRSGACGSKLSTDKVSSCVNSSMESRKRSMTHVFISHLIQGSEKSKGKDNQPLNAFQLLPSQSSCNSADKNDLNGALTTHMVDSTTYENMRETGDRVPIVLEHREGKEDGLTNKNFSFLSLTRGVGLQANSEAKGQVPHLHSASSTSTTCVTYKAYRDQAAVGSLALPRVLPQMQLQMPQYFAGTFNATHMSQPGTGRPAQIAQPNLQQQHLKQQQVQLPRHQQLQSPQQHQHLQQQQLRFPPPQQHLQQQPLHLPQLQPQQQHNQNLHPQQLQLQHQQHHPQQQIWTSQLPAQFRPGPLLPSHIQNWQNLKQDFRISTQAWPTSCQPSREMTGPKFIHIPQHSQQLIERCPPAPLSSTKTHPGQLPAVCENKGGRFQPDGALPFQLLCNKQ